MTENDNRKCPWEICEMTRSGSRPDIAAKNPDFCRAQDEATLEIILRYKEKHGIPNAIEHISAQLKLMERIQGQCLYDLSGLIEQYQNVLDALYLEDSLSTSGSV